MILTEIERLQVERIKSKTGCLKALDSKCEVFGSKSWSYKWPACASEKDVAVVETKYGIELPREYRIYLRYVANGGPGFAYGLYPLEKCEIFGDIKKDCTCFPFIGHEDFERIEELQQAIWDEDEDSEIDLFYDGLLAIATEGCTFDICLVITGKYRGRLVRTDHNEEGPFFFIYDENFLDWYERWLDDFIAGMDMNSFGGSVKGSQAGLRQMFLAENNAMFKNDIVFSLGRFPVIEQETTDFLLDLCRNNTDVDICYTALRRLIYKKVPGVFEVMRELFDSTDDNRRNLCIRLLSFASKNGVSVESFIPQLLEFMSTLSDDLFSNAVWAVQATSFNRYEVLLPFLSLTDKSKLITALWAVGETPDKVDIDFVDRVISFFDHENEDIVRYAILALTEIRDNRVPPLVDGAFERFPEFETLRKNYYRRTWGRM